MKTILKNQENKIAKLETEIVEVKSNLVELGRKFEEFLFLKSDKNMDVFQCDFCEKTYKSKSGLEKHMETHQTLTQLHGNLSLIDL